MNNVLPNYSLTAICTLFPELSRDQVQCLLYYSLGFSSEKVASINGCSSKTIRNKISSIREKLSLSSTSELRVIFFLRILIPTQNNT